MNKITLISLFFLLSITKGQIERICSTYESPKQKFFYPFDYEVIFNLNSKDHAGKPYLTKPTDDKWKSFTYKSTEFRIKRIARSTKENPDNDEEIEGEIHNSKNLAKKTDTFVPILFCAYDDQNVYLVRKVQGYPLSDSKALERIHKMTPIEIADLFLRPASGLSSMDEVSIDLVHTDINVNNLILDKWDNIYIKDISEARLFNDINVFSKESVYTPSAAFGISYVAKAIENLEEVEHKRLHRLIKKFYKEEKNMYAKPENSVYSLALSIVLTISEPASATAKDLSDYIIFGETIHYNSINDGKIPEYCLQGLMHIDRENCIDKVLENIEFIFKAQNQLLKENKLGSLSYGEIKKNAFIYEKMNFSTLLYKIIEYTDEWKITPKIFQEKLEQIKAAYIANAPEMVQKPLLRMLERKEKLYSQQIEYQHTLGQKIAVEHTLGLKEKSSNYFDSIKKWEEEIQKKSAAEIEKYQEKLSIKHNNDENTNELVQLHLISDDSYKTADATTPVTTNTEEEMRKSYDSTTPLTSSTREETGTAAIQRIRYKNKSVNFEPRRTINKRRTIIDVDKMEPLTEETEFKSPIKRTPSRLDSLSRPKLLKSFYPSTTSKGEIDVQRLIRNISTKDFGQTPKKVSEFDEPTPFLNRVRKLPTNNYMTNQKSMARMGTMGNGPYGGMNSSQSTYFGVLGTPAKVNTKPQTAIKSRISQWGSTPVSSAFELPSLVNTPGSKLLII